VTGEPKNLGEFLHFPVDDLHIYISREVWEDLKPTQEKFLVSLQEYGRFWIHLRRSDAADE